MCVQAATDTDTHVFRVRVLQAFLASGTPLNRLRFFRPVLERDGLKLTDASHMAQYIPLVEEREYKLLKMELHSHFLGIAFDGTSRLGEAVNVVGRFCTDKFEIVHRLLRFLTTKLHMKGSEFATMITRVVVLELGIDPALLVNIARDSVAVNGAAARILLESPFSCAENQLCIALCAHPEQCRRCALIRHSPGVHDALAGIGWRAEPEPWSASTLEVDCVAHSCARLLENAMTQRCRDSIRVGRAL